MKLNKSIIVSIPVIALIGVIGFGLYFNNLNKGDDQPPSLELFTTKFKGAIIDAEHGFYEFTKDDTLRYVSENLINLKKAPKGVNYFSTTAPITVGEIFNDLVKPDEKLKTLFVLYNYSPTEFNSRPCFLVYPEGPFSETCPIGTENINNLNIDPYTVFIFMANKEFEYDSTRIIDAKTFAGTFAFDPPADEEGWVLTHLSSTNNFDNPRIKSVWIQTDQNSFEKHLDPLNIDLSIPYKMAWVHFGKEPMVDPYIRR